MSTVAIIVAGSAASSAERERENKLSAKHLATMNNQECEYQIRVNNGYRCMTQAQYNEYQNRPTNLSDILGVGIILLFFAILIYMLHRAIR